VVKRTENGYAGSMRKHDSARMDEDEDEQPLADKLPSALSLVAAWAAEKADKKKSGGEKDVYGDLGNDLGEEPVPEPPD